MNLMLSNYGHRYLRERFQQPTDAPGLDEDTDGSLIALHSGHPMDRSAIDRLIAQGLLQPARPGMRPEDIAPYAPT